MGKVDRMLAKTSKGVEKCRNNVICWYEGAVPAVTHQTRGRGGRTKVEQQTSERMIRKDWTGGTLQAVCMSVARDVRFANTLAAN